MTTDAANRYRDLVAQALEAAGAVDDQELKRIAFEHVLDHLLGNGEGHPPAEAPRAPSVSQTPAPEPIDSALATEQQRIDAVARYFQIEPSQVGELFDLSGEEPLVTVHSRKLPKSKAEAVRSLALLVGGVRTAVQLETRALHIRQVADSYGKYDANNFMKTLADMDTVAVVGRTGSPNRQVRMKVTGAEAARPLAHKLVA